MSAGVELFDSFEQYKIIYDEVAEIVYSSEPMRLFYMSREFLLKYPYLAKKKTWKPKVNTAAK